MKILIVDDEPLARSELAYLIKKSPSLKDQPLQLYQAEDIKAAQSFLLKDKIAVVFLDISLNEENGFELADELKQVDYSPLIVFATAYDEYAVKAFDVGALDYILKPFEQERVDQSLAKAVKNLNQQQEAKQEVRNGNQVSKILSIELADRKVLVKKSEIITATINEGTLTITTLEQRYDTKRTLSWLVNKLTEDKFVQVHRNSLVNIEYVKEVQPWFNHTLLLVMRNGDKVQVGRSYRKELDAKLGM